MADTTVDKLSRMLKELGEHKQRLELRAKALRDLAKNEPDKAKSELMLLVAEGFGELVDTGLDFQVDLTETFLEAMGALGVDDGEVAVDGEDDEVEVGLEPEDAEQILKTLGAYREMIVAYEEQVAADPKVAPAQVAELRRRREECVSTIELVEGLVLLDDDEAGGDAEADDDEEEDGEDEAAEGGAGDGAAPPTS